MSGQTLHNNHSVSNVTINNGKRSELCRFLVFNFSTYYNIYGDIFMLILTRRPGESIIINDHITITLLEMQGNQTRIGIDAPRDVAVHREEIYLKIQQQKQAANDEDAA